jgi:hypothetical protein
MKYDQDKYPKPLSANEKRKVIRLLKAQIRQLQKEIVWLETGVILTKGKPRGPQRAVYKPN